jgi:hypothetical protein
MDSTAHPIARSLLPMDLVKVSGHDQLAIHEEETT